jgi:hypothetical protein
VKMIPDTPEGVHFKTTLVEVFLQIRATVEHLCKKEIRPDVYINLQCINESSFMSKHAHLVGAHFDMFHHKWWFPSDEDHLHSADKEDLCYCICDDLLQEWLPSHSTLSWSRS